MSRDRFKIGEIIRITGSSHNPELYGIDLIINRLDGDGAPLISYIGKGRTTLTDFVNDTDCELSIVASSPLWLALR